MAKIVTGLKDICTDCDLVIEVAPENMELLDYLDAHRSELDPQAAREAQTVSR